MKKTLFAAAVLTAFVGAASAQSSVTLFGIVDINARSVSNGSAGSLKSLSTGGQASNRLGFRGVEDLGGGMSAGFWIEGDLAPDTGNSAGMTWTRRSTISLTGGFGEVRFGRDYTPTFMNVSAYDMFGYVGVSSMSNVRGSFLGQGSVGTAVRANNTISYVLPAMGGLYGQATVAAGEGTQGNKYMGARLGYAAGPVNVSGAFGKTYKLGTMTADLKSMSFGASFNAGFMTVQGFYEKSDYGSADQKLLSGGVMVPVGAGVIKLNLTKASGSSKTYEATVLGAGYVHNLSKRTSLYVGYGRIANGGNAALGAKYTASTSGPAGILGGQTSTGYDFGVRHNF